jgi:hypothetical protein
MELNAQDGADRIVQQRLLRKSVEFEPQAGGAICLLERDCQLGENGAGSRDIQGHLLLFRLKHSSSGRRTLS